MNEKVITLRVTPIAYEMKLILECIFLLENKMAFNKITDEKPSYLEWNEILKKAVNEPGKLLAAYSAFHDYSIGNQMAAMFQCMERDIDPGPIGTFNFWKKKGRFVNAGQKAIWICQPFTVEDKKFSEQNPDKPKRFKRIFLWKKGWFCLSQTGGKDIDPAEFQIKDWNFEKALELLDIKQVPFTMTDGNVQGYAQKRTLALNPVGAEPIKTAFHEIAHIMLGHTEINVDHNIENLPRNLREAEAESVAMICCESLGIPGAEYCRGYIQHWYGKGNEIPEHNAARIFNVADTILKAGTGQLQKYREQENNSQSEVVSQVV